MGVREALKLLRYELGMTQNDFAKKVNRAYITVNRWENGKGFPSRANARTILNLAKKGQASQDCITYLEEVLMPDSMRNYSAVSLGFPDIDREFLFQLADGSTNALYVIEAETYKLLYSNRKADKMATKFLRETGLDIDRRTWSEEKDKHCYHYFANRNSPCEYCPLHKMNADGFCDLAVNIPETNKRMRIHAKQTEANGKRVYVLYLTDITDADLERQALYEMTNDIPVGAGIYNVFYDGRIELVFMNRILYQMFDERRRSGLRNDGKTDLCLIHPKDKDKLNDEIKASFKSKGNISVDLQMKLSDGAYHLLHLDARIIRKDKEKHVYYCTFDETENKARENCNESDN